MSSEKDSTAPQLTVSASQAAEMLGVSYKTVLRLILRGKLRTVPGLRHKRISLADVHRLVDGQPKITITSYSPEGE